MTYEECKIQLILLGYKVEEPSGDGDVWVWTDSKVELPEELTDDTQMYYPYQPDMVRPFTYQVIIDVLIKGINR